MTERGFPLSPGELAQAAATLAGLDNRYGNLTLDQRTDGFWLVYDRLCAEERERERWRAANPPSTRKEVSNAAATTR